MKATERPSATEHLAPLLVKNAALENASGRSTLPRQAPGHTVTAWLEHWNDSPKASLDEVLPRMEKELRRMASSFLFADGPAVTFEATELVNELYLRLLSRRQVSWSDRSHFFGFAARCMRRILVDRARARRCSKRGGGQVAIELDEAIGQGFEGYEPDFELLQLDLALDELAELSPRQHRIVEWHIFAGLTFDQIAELLELSNATVRRDWATARAWLYTQIAS